MRLRANLILASFLLIPLTLWAGESYANASLWRVIFLEDYNTRLVVVGCMLLGLASGLVGTYLFLQKRALLGDALSHATLPGVAIAFMLQVALGMEGKSLPGLFLGAVVFGLLGVASVHVITQTTRLSQDAALGIVLATFFGFGTALFGLIQQMHGVDAAGLTHFIVGHTAAMRYQDAVGMGIAAAVVSLMIILFRKEFAQLVFDRQGAITQGWPVHFLDFMLMTAVTGVVVIGLQAVGAILMLALLVIPPAAARFWTNNLNSMLIISGLIGALSGWGGCIASAFISEAPTGPSIVLCAAFAFFLSMVLGTKRGVFPAWVSRRSLMRSVQQRTILRHLLDDPTNEIGTDKFIHAERLAKAGHLNIQNKTATLTDSGTQLALGIKRNHELWQAFLLTKSEQAGNILDSDLPILDEVLSEEDILALEQAYVHETGHSVTQVPT